MIKAPLSTEKAIRLMESENKLVFIVDQKATKAEIKAEIELLFKAKVKKVNTFIGPDSKKKAYVTFTDETPAVDIATKLELM
ncbi:50S ribosomal protein L23 [Candidatus Woesearchaeota archaeon]|nr:50S ribosomal protein L23 [Candidatus Woesearchaeota archaeon]